MSLISHTHTDMDRMKTTCWTDNSSLVTKVEWFKHKMATSYKTETTHWTAALDQTLVTELMKMKDISTTCHHTPSRTRNRFAYERVPNDWTKIPTLIEDMNVALNATENWHTDLRHNPVLAAFMSNFSTMIEVAMRLEMRPNVQHVIVCDYVMSAKHMLLIMLVFELLFKGRNGNFGVFMHLCVNEGQERIARRSPIKSKYVIVHRDMPWYAALSTAEITHMNSSITMMMNAEMSLNNIQSLLSNEDVFVCLTASMDKVNYSIALMEMIKVRNMVRELVPGSDSDSNMVRISDAITTHNTTKGKLVYGNKDMHPAEVINASTNMIRPMNLGGMCFDCRIVYMVASETMIRTHIQDEDEAEHNTEEWSQSFAMTITRDVYEYLLAE